MKKIFLTILISAVFSAVFSQKKVEVRTGIWRGTLQTNGGDLPFGLEIQKNADGKTYSVFALNDEEKLKMDVAKVVGDSLKIPMELFDSELIGKISDKKLTGFWRKKRSNGTFVVVNFKAEFGKKYRFFESNSSVTSSLSGKYATIFTNEDKSHSSKAIGVFEQKNNLVKGTFLTSTGDDRYLAGEVKNDSLFLSTFDGNHAYLFKAKFDNSSKTLTGDYWSNGTIYKSWVAKQDAAAELPDEKSLTFLKDGFSTIDFSFPDVQHKKVSLSDKKFKNKVVIVQILGTWCPNCMDESRFLAPWYKKNKNRGIEIIGLSYEKFTDPKIALPKIAGMKKRFGITYDVLLAGSNDNEKASETLPMLNKVIGFPTTIFIDRKGKVKEIHTGFSGPGTGKYYDEFVNNFNDLIDKMVAEK